MGREIKRVDLKFDHPLNKRWSGYVCPDDVDYDNFEKTEPPTGEGWQMWETVSEGSPVSPVFETREGLIHWMVDNHYSGWAVDAAWRGDDWFPSMIGYNGRLAPVQER